MARSIVLTRVWDIPIKLHWTFLLVLPLFGYLMGDAYFAGPGGAVLLDYAWGGALAIALFASVILHELGHSWTAQRYGVPIRGITLLPIGGVAEMSRIPDEPRQEFRVALAGPVVSVAIGAPIVLLHQFVGVPAIVPKVGTFVFWLGYLNVFLAAFNMLPAFPMDGGRVLRAGLAGRMGQRRATEISAAIGRFLAIAMGLIGFLALAEGGWILLLIALFIYLGASQEESQVQANVALGNLTARDAMTADVRTVAPGETVDAVVEAMMETRHLTFPVVEGDRVLGVVGLEQVGEIPRSERETTRVRDVMHEQVHRVEPTTPARDLLRPLGQGEQGRLVIVEEDGRFLGVISRTDLVRLIRILQSGGSSKEAPVPGRTGTAQEPPF